MRLDFDLFESYASDDLCFEGLRRVFKDGVPEFGGGDTFGFTDSVENQYVNNLCEFLIGQPNRKNKSISVLCLTGHGLSPHSAKNLRDKPIEDGYVRTPYLPWDLVNCSDMMGRGNTPQTKYTPHTVTKGASAGDVVAFHSGLLSPKWVLDQLQKRDRCSEQIASLVIIIVDACYSGQWVTYFKANERLEHTKVIVQTACGDDEVSYGNLFIPLWIELQKMTRKDIQGDDSLEFALKQTPSLYCGPGIQVQDINIDGVCEIQQGGKIFRFFSQPDFFLRFCARHCARHSIKSIAAVRGGTLGEIKAMNTAFTDNSIDILCFRLTIYDEGGIKDYHDTPMALVLVEWLSRSGTKLLHLHLHFEGFSNPLTLSRLNNINVRPSGGKWTYKEKTKKDTNDEIRGGVDPAKITRVITDFVSDKLKSTSWCTEKSQWRMSTALPKDLIRSKSSILEEFMP